MAKHSYAICTEHKGYEASLELRKLYEVIADADAAAHGQLRVIDESGEDYLYPSSYFAVVDLPAAIAAQVDHAA